MRNHGQDLKKLKPERYTYQEKPNIYLIFFNFLQELTIFYFQKRILLSEYYSLQFHNLLRFPIFLKYKLLTFPISRESTYAKGFYQYKLTFLTFKKSQNNAIIFADTIGNIEKSLILAVF